MRRQISDKTTEKPTRRINRKRSGCSTLKRTQRGYVRNLGRQPNGTQLKFYLGHDRDQANVREKQLVALLSLVGRQAIRILGTLKEAVWTDEYLETAKAIATTTS